MKIDYIIIVSLKIIKGVSNIYRRSSSILCYNSNKLWTVAILININSVFSYLLRLRFTLYRLFMNFRQFIDKC